MRMLATLLTLVSSTLMVGAAAAETPLVAPAAPPPSAPPVPSADSAPVAQTAPTTTTHDHARVGALFLRGQLGVGHLAIHTPTSIGEITSSGVGGSGTLAMGATVMPQLVLYGQASLQRVTDPTLAANGRSIEGKGMKMDMLWFGPGITYYFVPVNVYVSTSVALSMVSSELEGSTTTAKSELGPALSVEVGKEWWIADRMGLGISAQGVWATMKDRGGDAGAITSRGLTLAASLSYN